MRIGLGLRWVACGGFIVVSCGGRSTLDDELLDGMGGRSLGDGAQYIGGQGTGVGGIATGGSGGLAGAAGTITKGGGGGVGGAVGWGGAAGRAGGGAAPVGVGGAAGTDAGSGGGGVGGGGNRNAGGMNAGGRVAAGGGSIGTGGSLCVLPAPNEDLIDDMNDNDRFIPQVNGRAGAWKCSHDDTPNVKMFPDPSRTFAMSATGDRCHKFAVRTYGGPFALWGAIVGFGLGAPYNASSYAGLTFWAKVDSSTDQMIRVAFPNADTDPDGGKCDPNATGRTGCYDHFRRRITISGSAWAKYTVRFDQLAQDGWGYRASSFDSSTIYETQFQIPEGSSFDFWIDDVSFVKK